MSGVRQGQGHGGDRIGASGGAQRGDDRRRPEGVAHTQARQAVGLREGPQHHRVLEREGEGGEVLVGELGVGVVDDDQGAGRAFGELRQLRAGARQSRGVVGGHEGDERGAGVHRRQYRRDREGAVLPGHPDAAAAGRARRSAGSSRRTGSAARGCGPVRGTRDTAGPGPRPLPRSRRPARARRRGARPGVPRGRWHRGSGARAPDRARGPRRRARTRGRALRSRRGRGPGDPGGARRP